MTGLPEGVRVTPPGPVVRWQLEVNAVAYDGYVFEDDPSDLAKFMRWLAEGTNFATPHRLRVDRLT